MNDIEIAELKDNILRFFIENDNEKSLSSNVYSDLRSQNITRDIIQNCIDDMVLDKTLVHFDIAGGRAFYSISNQGKRTLREGGYKKLLEVELKKTQTLNELDQKYREKINLEIANLKASIKNYRRTGRRSIWALVISIISIAVSIFLKFYLG